MSLPVDPQLCARRVLESITYRSLRPLPCSIRTIILLLSMSLGSKARVSPNRKPPL